ncbi:MAG: ABC transporter ATP-binding protein [Deltaproteobacteria bacterium]|nr:MAG: ABC transporter ATP-binding protein [Deltaproteobacteria bacterium]
MIELAHVTVRYGSVEALSDVTATIEGRVIGLLGPNGAGKSTLLKVLLGLTEFSGDARVWDLSCRTDALRIRDRIGYMPERDSYLADLNAVEMCAYAGELGGLPRHEAMQRAHEALYYAGLEDKRYLPVAGYSTGLKQRVKLAQALVHDPKLLFLDEPTNGLDPRARDEMLALIEDLPARRGCTVVLSTHLLADVDRVCDAVAILQSGHIRYSGSIAALRSGGGDGVYDVGVKRDAPALAQRLAAAGCRVDVRDPLHLEVALPAGADARLVLHHARDAGVQVRHIAPRTVSLETAFLREIGAAP